MDLSSSYSLVLVLEIYEGYSQCVGEIKRQDEPITIDVLHAIDALLEAEWQQTEEPISRKKTAEMGAWIVGGFCTGLRGEEMLLRGRHFFCRHFRANRRKEPYVV